MWLQLLLFPFVLLQFHNLQVSSQVINMIQNTLMTRPWIEIGNSYYSYNFTLLTFLFIPRQDTIAWTIKPGPR
jgi:hypothetical protein